MFVVFNPLNFGEICYMAWITDRTTLESQQKVQINFEPKILLLSSFFLRGGVHLAWYAGSSLLIVPQPGIKSVLPALDAQSPNYWSCQKV